MLILNRQKSQSVIITTKSGEKIVVGILGEASNPEYGYAVSFEADDNVQIHREEQYNYFVKIGKIKDDSITFNTDPIPDYVLDKNINGNK